MAIVLTSIRQGQAGGTPMPMRLLEKPSEAKGIPQCVTVTAATAIMEYLLRGLQEATARATSAMDVKIVFLPEAEIEQA